MAGQRQKQLEAPVVVAAEAEEVDRWPLLKNLKVQQASASKMR